MTAPTARPALSTAVMTHPARRAHAERLVERHPGLAATLVLDPVPGRRSTLRTAAVAWAHADTGHHLVLQDDVDPADDLLDRAATAVAAAPDAAVALFSEWGCRTAGRVRVAALAGEALAPVVDPYVPTQALVLPADVARAFAAHAERLDDDVPDDVAVRAFLVAEGVRQVVAVPHLVQHDARPGLVSGTGNSFQGPRRATCLPGRAAPRTGGPGSVPTASPGPRRLGHVGWMRATAEVFDDDPRSAPAFVGRPLHDALPATVDREDLARRFRAGLAAVVERHGPALTEVLDPTVLIEVWSAWFATGLGTDLTAAQLDDGRSDPVARTALETVLHGVFRRYVPVATLDRVAEHGRALVLDALRTGAAAPDGIRSAWLTGAHG